MGINDWISVYAPLLSGLRRGKLAQYLGRTLPVPPVPEVRLTRIDALELWDAHRTSIVLVIFAVLVTVRVFLHASDQRGGLVALPKIYGEREPEIAPEEAESQTGTDEETESLPDESSMTTSAGGSKGSRQGLRRRAG